tara:strand:- start:246 stop:434 length:189 start_codon:yes stop_codon:yes gene_type:complete
MSKEIQKDTVAVAVRIEHIPEHDEVFLVFKIVNERFKKRIKTDWSEDIELKVIDKNLILNNE